MKNSFIYGDARGKKSFTPFAWSLMAIFAVLVVVTTLGITNANATHSVVETTPQPITLATVTQSLLPGPTARAVTTDGCPTDPSQWDFVEVSPDSNYKRIEPTCVYDGLAITVAWSALSWSYGYDAIDAAELLGYEKIARASDNRLGQFVPFGIFKKLIIRSFQGFELATIEPTYPLMDRELRMWILGPNKEPYAGTFVLQGCYRTYDVVGNEKHYIWDAYKDQFYESICQVAVDYPSSGWAIIDYGEDLIYSSESDGGRSLMYFGYDTSVGVWNLIGLSSENMEVSSLKSLSSEYALMREWYGAPLWDDAWFQSFNISAASLPDEWERHNSTADFDAIMSRYRQIDQ